MIFLLISVFLLLTSDIFANECDNSFIVLPKIYQKDGDENRCRFNPLLHISTDDRTAIDYFEMQNSEPKDSFSILPRGLYDTRNDLKSFYPVIPFVNGVKRKTAGKTRGKLFRK